MGHLLRTRGSNICHPTSFILLVQTIYKYNFYSISMRASDELRVDKICLDNQKLVKIHFYLQEVIGGPNSTVYEVASANVSTDALASFGTINVLDDVITIGPGRDSTELGKLQGIAASADMKVTAVAMTFNVVFTSGEYKGSTLSIAGRNQALDRERHLAVVGGTGVFRFTRGYVVASTYSSRVVDSAIYFVAEVSIYTTVCPM